MTFLDEPTTTTRTSSFTEQRDALSDERRALLLSLKEDVIRDIKVARGRRRVFYPIVIDATQQFSRKLKRYGYQSRVVMELETAEQEDLLRGIIQLLNRDPYCTAARVSLESVRYHCRHQHDESNVGFMKIEVN